MFTLALRNVDSFRMQAQETSLHLSHTFSLDQENLFPWPRDLCVVSRCITQSSSRFLHLEINLEAYQMHRVWAGNAEMPGHLQRCRTKALWWAPAEVYLTRESFFWSPVALPVPMSSCSWPRLVGPGMVLYRSLTDRSSFSGLLTGTRAGIQYVQGLKLWKYDTWFAIRENYLSKM